MQDRKIATFIKSLGQSVDILPKKALEIFDVSRFRLARGSGGKHLQILFERKWMNLYREDLYGECGTDWTGADIKKMKASFRECILYGVRVDREKGDFVCIDSLTDG